MTTDTERCGAVRDYPLPDHVSADYPCVLDRGHDGVHRDRDGDIFVDAEEAEAPRLVTDVGLSDVTGTLAAILDLLRERLPGLVAPAKEVPTSSTCPAVLNLGGSKDYPCVLYRGHPGSHLDDDDDHWSITGV